MVAGAWFAQRWVIHIYLYIPVFSFHNSDFADVEILKVGE